MAVLVAASVSVSDVSIDTTGARSSVVELVDDGMSAAGFMVFVSILAILCEVAVITVRFLNFGAINRFFLMFVIVVSKTLPCTVISRREHYEIYRWIFLFAQ